MSDNTDDELGMSRPITRRDFLDGVAVGAGALALGGMLAGAGSASAAEVGPGVGPAPKGNGPDGSIGKGYYPPDWHGLRGQYEGAQATPHAIASGSFWATAPAPTATKEKYDLVVVGAGISGLSAARFFQKEHPKARILILETLDDVGGHARRNQYETTARELVMYGGSQSIEAPSSYNPESAALLKDVGIEVKRFSKFFDSGFNKKHDLTNNAVFFDKETYGSDHLSVVPSGTTWADRLQDAPLTDADRAKLAELLDKADPHQIFAGTKNYFVNDDGTAMTKAEIYDELAGLTYAQALIKWAGVDPDSLAMTYLKTLPDGNWGYWADSVGALDATIEFPGFGATRPSDGKDSYGDWLNDWDHDPDPRFAPTGIKEWYSDDPYIYHFPEGNAGVAYSLVRKLIPNALPGKGMETITSSDIRYGQLDHQKNRVRVRLNATVAKVEHATTTSVTVTYLRGDKLETVTGAHVILACNNNVIEYIAPELGDADKAAQKQALHDWSTRLVIIYTSVEIRNWQAFKKMGVANVKFPNMFWKGASLDYPVSMGTYKFPSDPSQPCLIHMSTAMCAPGDDWDNPVHPMEQAKAARRTLVDMTFEELEHSIRDQLQRTLGQYGFNAADDIQAITVNRWAHAYAYEYGLPQDAAVWPYGALPAHIQRQPWGRIAIAATDSGARAYVDCAISQAYRAVAQVLGKPKGKWGHGANGIDGADPLHRGPLAVTPMPGH